MEDVMTAKIETKKAGVRFYLTAEDFYPDALTSTDPELLQRFEKHRFLELYEMGFHDCPADPSARFLWQVCRVFLRDLTAIPELELARDKVKVEPTGDDIDNLTSLVPFIVGSEYVNETWIRHLFQKLKQVFARQVRKYEGTVNLYLTEKNQNMRLPERIFFHLVENREDKDYPFAFLATYATKESNGKIRHVPLSYALTEYQGDRKKLIALLSCLDKAAEVSELVAGFMESGEMFHALRLTAEEAFQFLKDVEKIEQAGILCRIPDWWRKRNKQMSASVRIGDKKPSLLGFESILSVQPQLVVDGVPLSRKEIEDLLKRSEGLVMLKGHWIAVDHARLKALLDQMEKYPSEISLLDAMRLGVKDNGEEDEGPVVTNGEWLSSFFQKLRRPETIETQKVPESFTATLRPYQKTGTAWLSYMDSLGFGACLADDMGLGKTVEVLGYLETLRAKEPDAKVLLIAPASLLGNWVKEASRFAPKMPLTVLHGPGAEERAAAIEGSGVFLVITTYAMAVRLKSLSKVNWRCLILDEAQAIKNPKTKQTRQIKDLKSDMRISMTGTPIENDLSNLWSQFDFLDKGLLGSFKEFTSFTRTLEDNPDGYQKLKNLVAPFMLRRLKTDKTIIKDLPERIDRDSYVDLSADQVVLYRKEVAGMEEKITGLEAGSFKRSGIVLTTLMHLKQICNHPDQYLGQEAFDPARSGKFEMLGQICRTICEKRERVLVFTQFKEMTKPLSEYLTGIFGMKGAIIDGSTPVSERTKIVEAFQGDAYLPYLVITVKAGGTGLTLTKANHVIHFDRWWNPAVEDQATDRAYRIGQKKNVIVHRLICRGTIEEKIDELINSKRELTRQVIGEGGEKWITTMSNEELTGLLTLDNRGGRG